MKVSQANLLPTIKFQVVQHGEIGITLDSLFYYPLNNLAESVAAAERGLLFSYGW